MGVSIIVAIAVQRALCDKEEREVLLNDCVCRIWYLWLGMAVGEIRQQFL